MNTLVNLLAIGSAGFLGAVTRYGVAVASERVFGKAFQVGTFVINVSGCFELGWFLAFVGSRVPVPEAVRLAVAVGFLGAYTTFSTFAFESNALAGNGAYAKAAVYVVGSVVVGLVAVRLGVALGSGQ